MKAKMLSAGRTQRRPEKAQTEPDRGGIYDGTVGWEDGQPHYELKDEGLAVVKVRLFMGHNGVTEGENTTPGRARGRKILARIDPRVDDIPDDGDTVFVAVPVGRSDMIAGGAIIKRLARDPKWIPNRKPGEKVIVGPRESFIRFKEDGTIFACCKSGTDPDTARPVQFELGPDGFRVDHPYGRLRCDKYGFELQHNSGAKISGGSCAVPAPLDTLGSFLNLEAAMVRVKSPVVSIGAAASSDNTLKAIPVLGTLDAMQTAIAACTEAIAAVVADLTNALIPATTSAPLSTAAGAATSAAGSALATCHGTGPTLAVRMS